MGERFTIYAGEPVVRLLDQALRTNRSGRINTAVERYQAMVEHELATLAFTESEWLAIIEANARAPWSESVGWQDLAANVWTDGQAALSERLRTLSVPAKIAIAEVVDRFVDRPRDKVIAKTLHACGVRLLLEEQT